MKKSYLIWIILAIVVIIIVGAVKYSYTNKLNNGEKCARASEFNTNPSLGPSNKPVDCCKGFVSIYSGSRYEPNNPEADENGCINLLGSASICSDCGNGICEEWENPCNCQKDCQIDKYSCLVTSDCMPTYIAGCAKKEWINKYSIGIVIESVLSINCSCINNTCYTNGKPFSQNKTL